MSYILGIDLGGSSIKAVAVTPAGETLAHASEPFEDRDMQWATRMHEIVARLEWERGGPAQAIGVSAPGLAAKDGRSIAVMPGRLHGLVGLDWTDYLGAPRPVPVLHANGVFLYASPVLTPSASSTCEWISWPRLSSGPNFSPRP